MSISRGQNLIKTVKDYFTEVRKIMPEVTDEQLCDEGDGEKVYYMNANDGTDFDWSCNNRLCEFFMFYKETELGFIKVFVSDNGDINGYLYGDKGHGKPVELPTINIGERDAEYFAALMCKVADEQDKFDKPISQINFDY
jgi:hypothetical protein